MNKKTAEIEALINLLEDPDVLVHLPVSDRLIQMGAPAVKILEHNWETAPDEIVRERIENIILRIQQTTLKKEIKDWADCRGEQLIYGAYLVARSQYPELSFDHIDYRLDQLRAQIWLEMNDRLTAMEKVRVINHFLFNVHQFSRSVRGVQSPQLFFINHVLETHKGLPISLAIIYAEIASRLEIPVYCVDLPHNFLLAYQDPTYLDDPDGIMFYINPYMKGAILGRSEVEYFLKEQKIDAGPKLMRPVSNIAAIERLAEGLRFAYTASGLDEKAAFLDELIGLLRKKRIDQIR